MNARFTFTRRNTLLGATTLAAWSLWACAALTASAILTQSIGPVAADPLLSLSGLYEVTSRLELPHLERWAIDKKTRICLLSFFFLFIFFFFFLFSFLFLFFFYPFSYCSSSFLLSDIVMFQYDFFF